MQQRINLVPQQALAEKIKKTIPWLVCLFVFVGCLVVFFIGQNLKERNRLLEASVDSLTTREQFLVSQRAELAALTVKMKEYEEREKSLRKRVSLLSAIPAKKHYFSKLLSGIAQVVPNTVRCEEINFTEQEGEIKGSAIVYKDLPEFVQKINALPGFRAASLSALDGKEDEDMKDGDDGELLYFTIIFELQK